MRRIILFCALGTLLVAIGIRPAEAVTLRVGLLGHASDAGIFIAQEMGYFAEQGIEVKMEKFRSAADMMAPLSAGQLDIAAGGISAGLFNAIARGLPAVVVADKGSLPPGFGFQSLMIRKDLWDSGQVRSVKDLKGKVVASNAAASPVTVYWKILLEREGMKVEDVNMKWMPFPMMVTALENKAIDAGIATEPNVTNAEAKGAAVRAFTLDKPFPGSTTATIIYSRDLAANRRDVAMKFMVAYVKALREYNQAVAEGGAKREKIIEILIKNTALKERALYDKMPWPGLNPDGYVNKESIVEFQKGFHELRQVTDIVPLEKVVDDSFAAKAVETLGPYRPK